MQVHILSDLAKRMAEAASVNNSSAPQASSAADACAEAAQMVTDAHGSIPSILHKYSGATQPANEVALDDVPGVPATAAARAVVLSLSAPPHTAASQSRHTLDATPIDACNKGVTCNDAAAASVAPAHTDEVRVAEATQCALPTSVDVLTSTCASQVATLMPSSQSSAPATLLPSSVDVATTADTLHALQPSVPSPSAWTRASAPSHATLEAAASKELTAAAESCLPQTEGECALSQDGRGIATLLPSPALSPTHRVHGEGTEPVAPETVHPATRTADALLPTSHGSADVLLQAASNTRHNRLSVDVSVTYTSAVGASVEAGSNSRSSARPDTAPAFPPQLVSRAAFSRSTAYEPRPSAAAAVAAAAAMRPHGDRRLCIAHT
ncbi:hypothetical protein EON66_01570, partial [archaeon]